MLQLAVAGRTIRTSSKTYVPSVILLRANLRIPQKRTNVRKKCLRKLQKPCQTIRKK